MPTNTNNSTDTELDNTPTTTGETTDTNTETDETTSSSGKSKKSSVKAPDPIKIDQEDDVTFKATTSSIKDIEIENSSSEEVNLDELKKIITDFKKINQTPKILPIPVTLGGNIQAEYQKLSLYEKNDDKDTDRIKMLRHFKYLNTKAKLEFIQNCTLQLYLSGFQINRGRETYFAKECFRQANVLADIINFDTNETRNELTAYELMSSSSVDGLAVIGELLKGTSVDLTNSVNNLGKTLVDLLNTIKTELYNTSLRIGHMSENINYVADKLADADDSEDSDDKDDGGGGGIIDIIFGGGGDN